jgi:hypothetical protein
MATKHQSRQCEHCNGVFTLRIYGTVVPPGRGRFCSRRCAAQRWRRGSDADRFWSYVNRDGPIPSYRPNLGPCWLWTGGTQRGYGAFHVENRIIGAHCWCYAALVGAIADGLELDHLCRVPRCVNPAHLEPVTKTTNILRGESIFAQNARRVTCNHGHPFDAANTIWRTRGRLRWRSCRTCQREYDRRRAPAKNARRRLRRRLAHTA